MNCPTCGAAMKAGQLQNTATGMIQTLFTEEGKSLRLRDLWAGNVVGPTIPSGATLPAYYCQSCQKIVAILAAE